MKLKVNTHSGLEARGLVLALVTYRFINADSNFEATSVVLDSEERTAQYVFPLQTVVPQYDKEVHANVGFSKIQEMLTGKRKYSFESLDVDVYSDKQFVEIRNAYSNLGGVEVPVEKGSIRISFDTVQRLHSILFPNETPKPSRVVSFKYTKPYCGPETRVIIVKEETSIFLSGLDVMDDFQYKSFKQSQIRDLKEIS